MRPFTPLETAVAELIRGARKEIAGDREVIARLAGMSLNTYARIERRHAHADLEQLAGIVAAMNALGRPADLADAAMLIARAARKVERPDGLEVSESRDRPEPETPRQPTRDSRPPRQR